MSEKLSGLVRHVLTFLGGFLITKGVIDEATLQEVIGAIITISGFIWSFTSKKEEVEKK